MTIAGFSSSLGRWYSIIRTTSVIAARVLVSRNSKSRCPQMRSSCARWFCQLSILYVPDFDPSHLISPHLSAPRIQPNSQVRLHSSRRPPHSPLLPPRHAVHSPFLPFNLRPTLIIRTLAPQHLLCPLLERINHNPRDLRRCSLAQRTIDSTRESYLKRQIDFRSRSAWLTCIALLWCLAIGRYGLEGEFLECPSRHQVRKY